MDKVKKFFIDFIKTRNILYYVVCGLAVMLFIGGIIATAALGVAGATALPLVFTLIGLLLFAGLSLVGKEKLGAAAVSFCGFVSLVMLICEVFEYFLIEIQNQGMSDKFDVFAIEGIGAFIVSVVILLICSIAANVFAWLKLNKPQAVPENVEQGEEKDEN